VDDDLRRELEQLAYSDAESGRARLAKITALRTLERLRRSEKPRDPEPVDRWGRWHPHPKGWEDLDRHDSDWTREFWRWQLTGER
jgi:hypothetical protein